MNSDRRSHTIRGCFLAAIATLVVIPTIGHAQFIDLRLDIEPKITAQTEQPLNFGTLVTNSGRQTVEFGSPDMGIFSISALENNLLLVSLEKPNELYHNDADIDDSIPLELSSRYGFSIQNYDDSYPLPDAASTIKVPQNPEPGPWSTIYLFMYGAVDIGDIPDGTYDNEIVLNVEYI